MTQAESQQIEELLLDWYVWQSSWAPALGHCRVDQSCRGFQESRQWLSLDERREIEEQKARRRKAEQVDVCVSGLRDWKHRAAIQVSMKNKTAGAAVFRSARLEGRDHSYYQEAKKLLCQQLLNRGLLQASSELDGRRT